VFFFEKRAVYKIT